MCGNKAKMIRGWCRVIWKNSLNIEAARFYRRVKAFYTRKKRVPELREIGVY
jgi:hypothetical protein